MFVYSTNSTNRLQIIHVTMQLYALISLLSLLWSTAFGYLIIVSFDTKPGSQIFDGSLVNYEDPIRKYSMNFDKSAAFVEKLMGVNSSNGVVTLKKSLACDGIEYPNVFTLYIDSYSNGNYEYISIPLKIYVRGCESKGREKGMVSLIRQTCLNRDRILKTFI